MFSVRSIGHVLKITNILLAQKAFKELKIRDINVSPAQIRVMQYLFDNQDLKVHQKDIEKLFKIRRSTISGILKTMEKNRMIERIDSSCDARLKEIILTNKAKFLAKDMQKKAIAFDKILNKNISDEDLNIFFKVMEQIQINIMNEERNDSCV